MNVSNCRGCGRLFNAISNEKICPSCQRELDEKFVQVKEFLRETSEASVEQVSKECDVSTKQIRQWVREERLTFSEHSMEGIECERCGTMIKTGRYCEACKLAVGNDLRGAMDRPKTIAQAKNVDKERDRMRFLKN